MPTKSVTSLLLVAAFGWLSACQEDDTPGVSANAEVFTVDEIIVRATSLAPVAFRSYDRALHTDSLGADTVELEEFGPFSVPATTSKVLENHYVILTSAEGYDAGIYLCDVYIAFASITLPPRAFVWQASATPEGYAIYQGDTKIAGTASPAVE